jgi:predicted PhzF superfamily epimerase YddE/YHI9
MGGQGSGRVLQRLAREMNFAETVFLLPPEEGGDARLRIFTPRTELPFAGHPVLGTAFVVGTALAADAEHSEHDADPGFQEFNRLADAFQPEHPLVYGGEVLHAV